jgi:uncharacterized membrane protein HdeD (DUF308 family)
VAESRAAQRKLEALAARRPRPTAAAMSTASSAPTFTGRGQAVASSDVLRRARRRLTIAGGLFALAGAAAIVLPNIASVATAIFVGWVLVAVSGLHAVDAFSTGDRTRTVLRLLLAALTFAAGLYLLLAPLHGTFTLTVVLAMWFLALGIARIVIGISNRGVPGAGITVLNGVASLVLGLLIALELPSSAAWALGLIVGIDLLISGALLLSLARAVSSWGRAGG